MQTHVLNIEDDLGAYTLLSWAYSELKLPVCLHRAIDGEDARSYLAREGQYLTAPRPALILLDLKMPGRSGLELLVSFKANPDTVNIPVVVLTCSVWKQDKENCLASGAGAFLIKPFNLDETLASVASAHRYAISV